MSIINELNLVKDKLYWKDGETSNSIILGLSSKSHIIISIDINKYIIERVVERESDETIRLSDWPFSYESEEGKKIKVLFQDVKQMLKSKEYIAYLESNKDLAIEKSKEFINNNFN